MKYDYLVIGAGIIGITIARELKIRYPDKSVCIIDKEIKTGLHGSGRNSGVLHAGFYYGADSLKAKFCREGNRLLTDYCNFNNLPINTCGKLVVAKNAAELDQLDVLYKRGIANGVDVRMLNLKEAVAIEPRVKTFERALWSPNTASADPLIVTRTLASEARSLGVEFFSGQAYVSHQIAGGVQKVKTTNLFLTTDYIINSAGLYADKVAKNFGFCSDYTILPFKGLYLYSDEPAGSLNTNIYPVPDPKFPFLGVHFTVTVDGHTKIGPTAIPAFWREHYSGFSNFSLSELGDVLWREASLMFNAGFDFRGLAVQEMKKYDPSYLVGLASQLLHGVNNENYTRWGKPGIRAQLLNIKTKQLVMDFCLEGDNKSMHILNAVSPAWTCSLPFAKHVADKIESLR